MIESGHLEKFQTTLYMVPFIESENVYHQRNCNIHGPQFPALVIGLRPNHQYLANLFGAHMDFTKQFMLPTYRLLQYYIRIQLENTD